MTERRQIPPVARPRRARKRRVQDRPVGASVATSIDTGRTDTNLGPGELLGLQRTIGNRATTVVIVRQRASAPADVEVPDAQKLIARDAPALLKIVSPSDIETFQRRLAIQARNDALVRQANQVQHQFESTYKLPYRGTGHIREKVHGLLDKRKPTGGPIEIQVPAERLFALDMLAPPDRDIAPTNAFRKKVREELATQPVRVVYSDRDEKIELHWGQFKKAHTRGELTLNDILRWGYTEDYNRLVADSPEKQQLRDAVKQLSDQYHEVTTLHLERSDKNKEHPIVRRIAEMFGGPDMDEIVRVMIDAKENPGKGTIEERLKELEAPYPSIKIWEKPKAHLEEARHAIRTGGIELGTLAVLRAETSVMDATARFAAYENKVLEGAGVAVKWLNRAKIAGKIAAGVATGGAGLGVQGLVAAGYSFAQEGAQQVSEVAHGLRESVDIGGLAKQAGVEGAMALFGGLTQGAFTKSLTARFGAQLAEAVGPKWAARIISGTSATTSQFYATPANIVLNRIIAGGPMPASMEELADMVASEAKFAAIMDFGLGMLTGQPAATPKAAGDGGATLPGETGTGPGKPLGGETPVRPGEEGGGGGGKQPPEGGGPGGKPPGGGDDRLLPGLSQAEVDAALDQAFSGTMAEGPATDPRAIAEVEALSRINNEVRELVAGRGLVEPPANAAELARSADEVALAQRILRDPNAEPAAIRQAVQVLAERSVADFRMRRQLTQHVEGEGAALTADSLRDYCGVGRDFSANSLTSLSLQTAHPILVARNQANYIVPQARHSFAVVTLPGAGQFLVDPSFAQFADQLSGKTFTSEKMLSSKSGAEIARNLLRDGYMPLTPETARQYVIGLGAKPENVDAAAAALMGGESSVLIDVVQNGTVEHFARRDDAYNVEHAIDPADPNFSSVGALDKLANRLGEDHPMTAQIRAISHRLTLLAAAQSGAKTPQ